MKFYWICLLFIINYCSAQETVPPTYDRNEHGTIYNDIHFLPNGDYLTVTYRPRIRNKHSAKSVFLRRDTAGRLKNIILTPFADSLVFKKIKSVNATTFLVEGIHRKLDDCSNYAPFVGLMDNNFAWKWRKDIDFANGQSLVLFQPTNDGGCFLSLYQYDEFGREKENFLYQILIKLDANGDTVWQQPYYTKYNCRTTAIFPWRDRIWLTETEQAEYPEVETGTIRSFDAVTDDSLSFDTIITELKWGEEFDKIALHRNRMLMYAKNEDKNMVLYWFDAQGKVVQQRTYEQDITPRLVTDTLYGVYGFTNYAVMIQPDGTIDNRKVQRLPPTGKMSPFNGKVYKVVYGKTTIYNPLTEHISEYDINPSQSADRYLYEPSSNFSIEQLITPDFAGGIEDMFVIDMNADGLRDLLVTNERNLFYYPAYAKGKFESDPRFITPQPQVKLYPDTDEYLPPPITIDRVTVGDLNRDDLSDIIFSQSASINDSLYWYKATGRGTYATPQPLAEAFKTDILLSADLDQNGTLELIQQSDLVTGVQIIQINPDTVTYQTIIERSLPKNTLVIDLNGDGFEDIFFHSDHRKKQMGYYRNPGNLTDEWELVDWSADYGKTEIIGNFRSETTPDTIKSTRKDYYIIANQDTLIQLYTNAASLKLTDLNADGKQDLLVVQPKRGVVSLLNQFPDSLRQLPHQLNGNHGYGTQFDYNLDDDPEAELIYFRHKTTNISYYDRTTDARERLFKKLVINAPLRTHDFDNDRYLDILHVEHSYAPANTGQINIFLNQKGQFDFNQPRIVQNLPYEYRLFHAGDFDPRRKGYDLILHGDSLQQIVWSQLQFLKGEPQLTLVATLELPFAVQSVQVIDYQQDGILDLFICGNRREWYRTTIEGNKFGILQSLENFPATHRSTLYAPPTPLQDYDLFWTTKNNSTISVEATRLDEAGNFDRNNYRRLLSVSKAASELTFTDFNNDGRTDVVVAAAGEVQWLENHPRGWIAQSFQQYGSTDETLLVDVDRDGDLDQIGVGKRKVFFYENVDGQGGFRETGETLYASEDYYLEYPLFFDVDRDGKKDLLVFMRDGGHILFKNTTK